MPLVALHAASIEQRTGILAIARESSSWRLRVELVRGWVHGFGVEPSPDLEPPARIGERRQRDAALAESIAPGVLAYAPAKRLAHLLGLAVRGGFRAAPLHEPRLAHVAATPFHPLAMLRATVELLLASGEPSVTQVVRGANGAFRLASTLHASGLDPDEQSATALLASARDWDELVRRSRCPPPRLLKLLRDAAALGALRIGDDDVAPTMLRLMREASNGTRAAYHARARAVHPDLHPEASPEEQRKLNDEMSDLSAKNRRG